jgi:hypothetical protein
VPRLPSKPGPVPPPGPEDFLVPLEPPVVALLREEVLPEVPPVGYLRLTPADQEFLARIGIRWRY